MTSYTGSLLGKRKSDLTEIANALGMTGAEGTKLADLRDWIQAKLEAEEATLRDSPVFKGLYSKRRNHTADTDVPVTPGSVAARSRKSINKVLDKVQETVIAASIPLPESPLPVAKVQAAASQTLALAATPAEDIVARFHKVSQALINFNSANKHRVEVWIRDVQELLSNPNSLLAAALVTELTALYLHIVPFYEHTVFFPPVGGEKGTIASLLHSIFFWLPSFAWTFRLPELHSFALNSDLWPALAWWFFSTVLPPLALSTIVSFVPQHGVHRAGGVTTRYQASHPPTPSVDPLTLAFFRLALLLLPLTSAAPSSFVDALEMSGNSQARALGAGLVAALILAERLRA